MRSNSHASPQKLILITAAKNEEALIGQTLASVVSQSLRPLEWVIVDDGSTDRTRTIVQEFAEKYSWIQLVAKPCRSERDFAAVVHAIDTGISACRAKDYDYVGLIDADLRFESNYFQAIIQHLENHPRSGLVGGMVVDVGDSKDQLPTNRQDVPGASQFFKRACFEAVLPLIAIPEGGWDAITCAKARMAGFETCLLTDYIVDHLKPRNVAHGGMVKRTWQFGVRDYALGYHPLYESLKCLGRIKNRPYIVGAAVWMLGYLTSALKRRQRYIPEDFLTFLRAEQINRIHHTISRCWPF